MGISPREATSFAVWELEQTLVKYATELNSQFTNCLYFNAVSNLLTEFAVLWIANDQTSLKSFEENEFTEENRVKHFRRVKKKNVTFNQNIVNFDASCSSRRNTVK